MTTSKHLAIRNAVEALYKAVPALADGRVEGNREYQLQQGEPSRIAVYRVDSNPQPADERLLGPTAPIDWTTTIRTVVKTRKDGATTAETANDSILAACYARVMADQTLGGLCGLLDPGSLVWEQDEADSNVVIGTWEFQVQHRTENNVIS